MDRGTLIDVKRYELLRRVPKMLYLEAKGRPESSLFEWNSERDPDGLSMTLFLSETDVSAIMLGHSDYGLVKIPASIWTTLAADVECITDPLVEPLNPNHVLVRTRLTKSQCRKISIAAVWIINPWV
jgi:hypothetical protein